MTHARSSPKRTPARIFAGALFPIAAGLALISCSDEPAPAGSVKALCGPEAYFTDTAWPQVFTTCSSCHVAGGVSGGTRFVLKPGSIDGAVHQNFRAVQKAARTLVDGKDPLLLLKPTMTVPHGGGLVVTPDTEKYAVLVKMVDLARDASQDAACGSAGSGVPTGVALMDARQTLRKASLQLVGRPPTQAEIDAASAGDPQKLDGIDAILRAMMKEDAFAERVKEIFNDAWLTDANRFETGANHVGSSVPKSLLATPECAPENWQSYTEGMNTPESHLCIAASEALAREPVEMAAHIVMSDRPFTEILTAQYRYLTVHAARVFGLDLSPFQGHMDDRHFFAEVKIPAMHGPSGLAEEYAGVVTTNSFLYRYNSTSTNRNRGRSYRYLKYFLGNDILKSAIRLDVSKVDPSSHPWLNNAQCTSCHATLDPIAGAFQHWTNCYDIHEVQYYETRYCPIADWFPPDDMFQPGTGPGPDKQLTAEQLPTALAVLGAATVNDPGFARVIASQVFTSILGQDLLKAPEDPSDPDYAALDAAHAAQEDTIDALGQAFAAANFDLKALIIAIVKTPQFRAITADKPDRLDLIGYGGGSMTPPEVLHRKIASIVGAPWVTAGGASDPNPGIADPPENLLSLKKFRILAGGIDSKNIRRRAREAGSISTAVTNRMALEMSCEYVARDFALDPKERTFFPKVEKSAMPSGDPKDPSQAPILDNLVYLHDRLLGEALAPDDPEILETYALLVELQKSGASAIGAGTAQAALPGPCQAISSYATGEALPAAKQFTDDPTYVVRAWQGVVAYLLMDYRFTTEE